MTTPLPQDDRHIATIAAIPPMALLGAAIETIIFPTPGQSYVLLVFVLAAPVLVAWLIVRVRRTDA